MIRKFLLVLCIQSSVLLCKPPLEFLQEFYEENQEECSYELSLLHGIVGFESDLLKNRWLYGNQTDATIKLLKTLFYVEEDDEFLITTRQPYSSFTPETILTLITHLYDKTLYIQDEQNNYTIKHDLFKTFKGNKAPRRIAELLQTIQKAEQEQCNNYPQGTVLQILLAFLYLKSDEHDLKNYREKISQLTPHQLYSDEPSSSTSMPYALLNKDQIQLLLQEIKHRNYLPNHPPNISWIRKVEYKSPPPISDCCETAIRKFINELVYDDETKTFNLQHLPEELHASIPEPVKDFYLLHNSAQTIEENNTPEIHSKWLHCVSDLPDTQYRKNGYEIHPDLINIISIISHLCGFKITQDPLNLEQYLNDFCKTLSIGKAFTINCNLLHWSSNIFTDISFNIIKKINTRSCNNSISMHIRKNHAWLTQDSENERFNENLLQTSISLENLSLSTLFASLLNLEEVSDTKVLETLLLSQQTRTKSEKKRCCEKLLRYYEKTKNPLLQRFAEGLVKSLSMSPLYNSNNEPTIQEYALDKLERMNQKE